MYIEVTAHRSSEENTSYRDALINTRKDEREVKKRAVSLDQLSETTSTTTALGQTTLA